MSRSRSSRAIPARSATARWRASVAAPTAQGGPAGAAASRASVVEPRRERGLLAHEVLGHAIPPAFEGVELCLDLDDAAIELLERAALLDEGPIDALELREERDLALPGRRGALAGLVELAAHLAERLLFGLEVLTAGRRRTGVRARAGEAGQREREQRGRSGTRRPDRLTPAPIRRGRPRGRRPARAPPPRRSGSPARYAGGAEGDRAPGPLGASSRSRGRRARTRGAGPPSPRSDPSAARATPWSRGGAARRNAGTPARRRMLTSAAPARRAARVAPAAAPSAAIPRTAPRARPPRRSPRRSRSSGSTQPKAACTSVTPGSRSSVSTSVWSSVGADRRGRGDLEPGGQRVRREVVETVPARTEQPPELGQRHGGPHVSNLRHPRAARGRARRRRPAPPAAGPAARSTTTSRRSARHARLGQTEREIAGQRRAHHEDGQRGEQHRGRGGRAAPPAAPERRREEVARQDRPRVGAAPPRAGALARRARGRARSTGSRPRTWSRAAPGSAGAPPPSRTPTRRASPWARRRARAAGESPGRGRAAPAGAHRARARGGARSGPGRARPRPSRRARVRAPPPVPCRARAGRRSGCRAPSGPGGDAHPARRHRGSGAAAPGRAPRASPPPSRPPARRPASGAPHR